MRIRASKTRRVLAYAVAFCAASCAPPAPVAVSRPHSPALPLVVVEDEHLSLRENEFLELHAFLAAAARSDGAALPNELEAARAAYARVLERDPDDAILRATAQALGECANVACAVAALDTHGLGTSFGRALPFFTAHEWDDRAATTWRAIERAHAAFGPSAEGVLLSLAKDLGVTWVKPAVPVDIVAVSTPAGRTALVSPFLAARGPCFAERRAESDDVRLSRIVDCVVVRALLGGESPHRAVLGERLWTVLVVHAVAATITGIEPRHLSVDRRSIAVIEPTLLELVTREWRSEPLNVEAWKERARTYVPPDSASR